MFTKGLILSKFQYFFPAIGVETSKELEPLEVAWRKALRVITGALPSTPKPLPHAESALLPLSLHIKYACARHLCRLLSKLNILDIQLSVMEWNGLQRSWSPLAAHEAALNSIPPGLLDFNKDYYDIEQYSLPNDAGLDAFFNTKLVLHDTRKEALKLHKENKLLCDRIISLWTDGGFKLEAKVGSAGCVVYNDKYNYNYISALDSS